MSEDKANLVIDASVLGHACQNNDLGDICFETLSRAERLFRIVLDHENHIVSEYERQMSQRPQNRAARWWVRVVSRVGSRYWCCGKLDRADQRRLEKSRFHNDDFAYVAVAKAAGGAPIVHQDSGYCKAESVIWTVAKSRCLRPPTFIQELDATGRLNVGRGGAQP